VHAPHRATGKDGDASIAPLDPAASGVILSPSLRPSLSRLRLATVFFGRGGGLRGGSAAPGAGLGLVRRVAAVGAAAASLNGADLGARRVSGTDRPGLAEGFRDASPRRRENDRLQRRGGRIAPFAPPLCPTGSRSPRSVRGRGYGGARRSDADGLAGRLGGGLRGLRSRTGSPSARRPWRAPVGGARPIQTGIGWR
jgi:hypothetical protein